LSKDIETHLQALYHSGQVSGYIVSKLPEGTLKTGWIEQGLLSKGMKGNLRDKNNQESLVIPADRFARLARDRGDWGDAAIVIIGSKGLTSTKFVSMAYGVKGSHSLIAFQMRNTSPIEIVRLLVQDALGKNVSTTFDEPNLDYVEQLQMDTSKGEVSEMIVLSLPKKQVKVSEWMKETLLSPSSDSIEVQHGSSNTIPRFAALVTRWLTGLELFKKTPNPIAALIFVGKKSMEVCLWDQPQRKTVFATFNVHTLEVLSSSYLTPLWLVPGESVTAPKPTRQVTVETSKTATKPLKPSPISSSSIDAEKRLAHLSKRLESVEFQLQSSSRDPDSSTADTGILEVLQTRLSENIERIEALSRRLVELEKRIRKIRS